MTSFAEPTLQPCTAQALAKPGKNSPCWTIWLCLARFDDLLLAQWGILRSCGAVGVTQPRPSWVETAQTHR